MPHQWMVFTGTVQKSQAVGICKLLWAPALGGRLQNNNFLARSSHTDRQGCHSPAVGSVRDTFGALPMSSVRGRGLPHDDSARSSAAQ